MAKNLTMESNKKTPELLLLSIHRAIQILMRKILGTWLFFQQFMITRSLVRGADEKFQKVVNWTSTEWVLETSSLVSQIWISFVIEHLICSQVEACMQHLQSNSKFLPWVGGDINGKFLSIFKWYLLMCMWESIQAHRRGKPPIAQVHRGAGNPQLQCSSMQNTQSGNSLLLCSSQTRKTTFCKDCKLIS